MEEKREQVKAMFEKMTELNNVGVARLEGYAQGFADALAQEGEEEDAGTESK